MNLYRAEVRDYSGDEPIDHVEWCVAGTFSLAVEQIKACLNDEETIIIVVQHNEDEDHVWVGEEDE